MHVKTRKNVDIFFHISDKSKIEIQLHNKIYKAIPTIFSNFIFIFDRRLI